KARRRVAAFQWGRAIRPEAPPHTADTETGSLRRLRRACADWRHRCPACDPALVGEDHRVYAVAESEFVEEMTDVRLDGGLAHDEVGGDFGVGESLGQEFQGLGLTPRELPQALG